MLVHIRAAVTLLLQQHEAFMLNWTLGPEQGYGRRSVWVSRHTPLTFTLSEAHTQSLDRTLVNSLVASSRTAEGMQVPSDHDVRASHAGAQAHFGWAPESGTNVPTETFTQDGF